MRGKAHRRKRSEHESGITPAYAGKRRTGPAVRDRSWDHPRVCGEKNACWGVPQTPLGSPPRMRGKAGATRRNQASTRITPAYAGKRVITHDHPSGDQDHPRVCGEKGSRIFPDPADRGSPPRVRGKDPNAATAHNTDGITPACAGKRSLPSEERNPVGDHPRVCGEKVSACLPRTLNLGSPPRVRGKEWYLQGESPAPGITPACAGKRFPPLRP